MSEETFSSPAPCPHPTTPTHHAPTVGTVQHDSTAPRPQALGGIAAQLAGNPSPERRTVDRIALMMD
jgi:hypothetical protein